MVFLIRDLAFGPSASLAGESSASIGSWVSASTTRWILYPKKTCSSVLCPHLASGSEFLFGFEYARMCDESIAIFFPFIAPIAIPIYRDAMRVRIIL